MKISSPGIGTDVRAGGEKPGGLSEQAAAELGLVNSTAIAAGFIDAHAGGIGTVGAVRKAGYCRVVVMYFGR